MAERIVFTGKQQVSFETFTLPELKPDEVRVKGLYSLMSTGTENIVFNRQFDAGTNWDRWVKYPFYPGYSSIGIVEAISNDVEDLTVGDIVATRTQHASHTVQNVARCYKIPAGIDPKLATWFSLAKIASMGAKAAEYKPGDSVLIIGAGPIGQMATRWAFALGCESILVADRIASRLELAHAGGATATIAEPIETAEAKILSANNGQKPRVVIDSTGNAVVFSYALKMAADRGRVVILGDTGFATSQHLTSDVISRGLSIVGAHDMHHDAVWSEARIIRLFCNLVLTGRFRLEGLNSHAFKPSDYAKAYEIANTHRDQTMGIIFDWKSYQAK